MARMVTGHNNVGLCQFEQLTLRYGYNSQLKSYLLESFLTHKYVNQSSHLYHHRTDVENEFRSRAHPVMSFQGLKKEISV